MADTDQDCLKSKQKYRSLQYGIVFVATTLALSMFLSYTLYISTLNTTHVNNGDIADAIAKLNQPRRMVKRHWEEGGGFYNDADNDYDDQFGVRSSESSTSSSTTSSSLRSSSSTTTTSTSSTIPRTSSRTSNVPSSTPSTEPSSSSSATPEASSSSSSEEQETSSTEPPSSSSSSEVSSTSSDAWSISSAESSSSSSEWSSSSSSESIVTSSSEPPSSTSSSTEDSSSSTSDPQPSTSSSSEVESSSTISSSPSSSPSPSPSPKSSSSSTTTTSSSFSNSQMPSYTPLPSIYNSGTSTVDYTTTSSSSSTSPGSMSTSGSGFFSTKTTPSPRKRQEGTSITQSIIKTVSSIFTTSPFPSLASTSSTYPTTKQSRSQGKQRPTTPSLVNSQLLAKTAAEDYFNSVTMSTSKPAGQGGASTDIPPENKTDKTNDKHVDESAKQDSNDKSTVSSPPVATPPPAPCFRKPFELRKVCSKMILKLAGIPNYQDVTLEDVSAMLFSQNVLATLQQQWAPSVWCLSNSQQREIVSDNKEYLKFCDLDCMLEIPDECMDDERRTVLATLGLLCEGHRRNVTDTCHQAMRKNSHVAMSDVYRSRKNSVQEVCRGEEMQQSCNGSCRQMASNLHCMCKACDHKMDMLAMYDVWSWFFSNETNSILPPNGAEQSAAASCNLNMTEIDCSLFDPQNYQNWWTALMRENTFLEAVREMDASIISGLITSFAITTVGVSAVVWVCVKRTPLLRNPFHRFYTREAVEYKELKNEIDVYDDDLEA